MLNSVDRHGATKQIDKHKDKQQHTRNNETINGAMIFRARLKDEKTTKSCSNFVPCIAPISFPTSQATLQKQRCPQNCKQTNSTTRSKRQNKTNAGSYQPFPTESTIILPYQSAISRWYRAHRPLTTQLELTSEVSAQHGQIPNFPQAPCKRYQK